MRPVLHVCAFNDNYIWLVSGDAARMIIVDPGDERPVIEALERERWTPAAIFCTHRHWDHSDGIPALCARYRLPVYGPAGEPVAGLTHAVRDGDVIALEGFAPYQVFDIPGHTRGHIAFYGDGALFCGDTLFSAGCGRLFEGTPAQMFASLARLAALPADTLVYCGHEYTLANLRFAATIEPDNADIRAAMDAASACRTQNRPTLPSTIGMERRINPFLRTQVPAVRTAVANELGSKLDSPVDVFAILRRRKDAFRG